MLVFEVISLNYNIYSGSPGISFTEFEQLIEGLGANPINKITSPLKDVCVNICFFSSKYFYTVYIGKYVYHVTRST